jgi:DnaJ-class molecular chaperone
MDVFRDPVSAPSGGRQTTCSCCGGSGVLRTETDGYRTCLECLGQGQKPRFETVFVLSEPLPAGLSASTSGAR